MKRSEKLMQVSQAFFDKHKAWISHIEQGLIPLDPKGNGPDSEYCELADEMLAVFDAVRPPRCCEDLALRVSAFQTEMQRYDIRLDPTEHKEPMDTFFAAARDIGSTLRKMRAESTLQPLESAAELKEQGVGLEQIGKMLGLFNAFGQADMSKVKEEVLKPGKHTTDEPNWKDPRLKDIPLLNDPTDGEYQEESKIPAATAKDAVDTCPESLTELIDQDVPPAQIAKMKGITVEAVHAAKIERAAELKALEEGAGSVHDPKERKGKKQTVEAV